MLDSLLPTPTTHEAVLWEAMRYGCLGGGKRIRPFLVLESASLFDIPSEVALRTAVALEMVHCYSLIHDDLPAMDNSDLRRNRPTVHRYFDEATAILAGDSLLTFAFQILSDPLSHPNPQIRCTLISNLAKASGAKGMIGGQMLDLLAENTPFSLHETSRLQTLKTAALIEFAATAGAVLGNASQTQTQALQNYAQHLGLAFQITDDLLDVEGHTQQIGKPTGQDTVENKATLVSLLGIPQARKKAQELVLQAQEYLKIFPKHTQTLNEFSQFILERRS